jgi:hypothetical protein
MIRRIVGVGVFYCLLVCPVGATDTSKVYPYAIPICAVIINEMTEGKVNLDQAREMALAIARAGNGHFGRVTCRDMWLYMAIVHVESGFKCHVVNEQNCRGLFQVHAPSWARKFGVQYADLLDMKVNAHCGIGVFKYYLHLYKGLVPTLSAYNSDHPRAAVGYAWAVLSAQNKIEKRYTALYQVIHGKGTTKNRVASKPPM